MCVRACVCEKDLYAQTPLYRPMDFEDYEEIEVAVLTEIKRAGSYGVHSWELKKKAAKAEMSERKLIECLDYLEQRGCFDQRLLSMKTYRLAAPGKDYLEELTKTPDCLMDELSPSKT